MSKTMMGELVTPAYYFNTDEFKRQIDFCASMLPRIALTYSIKANSFLIKAIPDSINHVEVCSPGELKICIENEIPGNRIIYSGVNKENEDVCEAIGYGVDIVTAESLKHVEVEQNVAKELGITQKVLLRLTSGNQFGMSQEDIFKVLSGDNSNIEIIGIHYYSGTQKKTRQIKKDLEHLRNVLESLKDKFAFEPQLVEYGPGLPIHYFVDDDKNDSECLAEIVPLLEDFAKDYPLGIEMGRFFASTCGTYATKVVDIKTNDDTNYVICDGGIHHIRYYGQTMSMQVPEIEVLAQDSGDYEDYCLCGSLCTVADVLVREVRLSRLAEGQILLFKKCGAYSVLEGNNLFLSRKLPSVFLVDDEGNTTEVRKQLETYSFNS